jgi:hypothetical protein
MEIIPPENIFETRADRKIRPTRSFVFHCQFIAEEPKLVTSLAALLRFAHPQLRFKDGNEKC